MTEQEIFELEQNYSESKIQHTCVAWFRQTFPHVGKLLFAVPNGGWRGAKAGFMMTYEGQVSGVADLILLYPRGGKASLCIEMKTPKKKGRQSGRQSPNQQEWQRLVETYGSTYVVCHGLMEFIRAVCRYLQVSSIPYTTIALHNYPYYR